jgi:hypothetical protein
MNELGRELEGMRAILASPSYGPVDPECAKDLRIAIMTTANHGLEWVADASPDKMMYSAARNHVTQGLWTAGPEFADGIVWVDSDIRQGAGDLLALLASARKYDADFVTGVYHQREGMHKPVFYHWHKGRQRFTPFKDYPEGVFAPIEGCGFGFVWTGWKVIEAIAKHPKFDRTEGWFPDKRDAGGFGEDLSFCYQAMCADVQLWINTAVQVGHLSDPRVIYRTDWQDKRSKAEEDGTADVKPVRQKWGG